MLQKMDDRFNMIQDMQLMDTSETIYISPIALIKMLKHGRA
jgi:hypothetical protein